MVVVGILAAVIVLLITSKWWSEGLISATEMIVLTAIYGGLVFGLFALAGTEEIGAVILVLIPLVGSVGWALYCNQKLGIKHYYREKIRNYERAIQADPRNTAARSMLADAYYELGDLDSAIAAMEVTVQMSSSALKEAYKLRQWQSERELRDSKTIICQVCYSKNLWGARLCRTCRHPLVYPQGNKWYQSGALHKHWMSVLTAAVWLTITIVAFVTLSLMQAFIVVTCMTLAGLGWILLSTSRT